MQVALGAHLVEPQHQAWLLDYTTFAQTAGAGAGVDTYPDVGAASKMVSPLLCDAIAALENNAAALEPETVPVLATSIRAARWWLVAPFQRTGSATVGPSD